VTRKYFVDEAGDGELFSRKGRVIVSSEGSSRFFILGLLDIENPTELGTRLAALRVQLLTDPYFKDVPSFQLRARKTALAFHAKDDLPEVRREVFTILKDTPGLRFFAVVKDKLSVLQYVRQRNQRDPGYRYRPSELYDLLVRRLFRDQLHKEDGYLIHFAKRGKSDRTAALLAALEAARRRFHEAKGIAGSGSLDVIPGTPAQFAGLQACDYYLWALQRLYERGDERYLTYIWDSFRLVQDIDDTRQAGYGIYYTKKKPLNAAALAWRNTKS